MVVTQPKGSVILARLVLRPSGIDPERLVFQAILRDVPLIEADNVETWFDNLGADQDYQLDLKLIRPKPDEEVEQLTFIAAMGRIRAVLQRT